MARPFCAEHKASAFRTLKRLGPSLPSQLYREVHNFARETTIREQCFTLLFDLRRANSFSLSLCPPFACECAQAAMRARQTFPLISWSRIRGIIRRERENVGQNTATSLSGESHPAIFARPPQSSLFSPLLRILPLCRIFHVRDILVEVYNSDAVHIRSQFSSIVAAQMK